MVEIWQPAGGNQNPGLDSLILQGRISDHGASEIYEGLLLMFLLAPVCLDYSSPGQ